MAQSEAGQTFRTKKAYKQFTGSRRYKHSFSSGKQDLVSKKGKRKNRQTYQGRDYAGKLGKFHENQKVLVRYNWGSKTDRNAIGRMIADFEEFGYLVSQIGVTELRKCAKTLESALHRYTPKDTGNLDSQWEVEVIPEEKRIEVRNDCVYCEAMEYGKYGEANGLKNGKPIYGWYPGYFMLAKSKHECLIKMREEVRKKVQAVKSKAGRRRNG
jgi:hypothetical protein